MKTYQNVLIVLIPGIIKLIINIKIHVSFDPESPNTTTGKSYLLSRKLRFLSNRRFKNLSDYTKFINHKDCSDSLEDTSLTKCDFSIIFFLFYTLFGSLSKNKLGRQDVPFVVLGHIYTQI